MTQDTRSGDRELLELAANAAGINVIRCRLSDPGCLDMLIANSARNPYQVAGPWNPLTDDGDALRLAVKLLIQVYPDDDNVEVFQFDVGYLDEPVVDDEQRPSATRRAIVRAAAEIGRQMQEGGAA